MESKSFFGGSGIFFVKSQKSFKTKKSQQLSFCFLNIMLGGGFKRFLFSPLFEEDSHFD